MLLLCNHELQAWPLSCTGGPPSQDTSVERNSKKVKKDLSLEVKEEDDELDVEDDEVTAFTLVYDFPPGQEDAE